jgi:hypothetical protein
LEIRGRIVLIHRPTAGIIQIVFEHDLLNKKPVPIDPTPEQTAQQIGMQIAQGMGINPAATSGVVMSDEQYGELGRPGVGHVFLIKLHGPIRDEEKQR